MTACLPSGILPQRPLPLIPYFFFLRIEHLIRRKVCSRNFVIGNAFVSLADLTVHALEIAVRRKISSEALGFSGAEAYQKKSRYQKGEKENLFH
jgi:hypothetical protein